ncbi:MAG TPA: EamA family transporter, partial [Beijerinckiaceae bacterium]|nr:EamA family transporter [Beijerinckiaceae bacterium]
WGMLIALSMLWGGSFLFVGLAVRELPPLTIVLFRVALAALALHAVIRSAGIPMPRDRRVWAAFLWMGLLNNAVPFTLITWAQGHVASGVASIFNATTPLFTALVAHWWTRDEKLSAGRVAGVAIGFAGVAIMMAAPDPWSFGADVMAEAALLTAAIFYAVSGVFGRRFKAMGVEPLATAAGVLTASSLLLLPVTLIIDRPWALPGPGATTVFAIFGLALLATALAYIIYFRILAVAGATNLLLVTFLIPVSAIALGAAVLGERLEPRHFYGMAMIGLGLGAIDGRPLGALRRMIRQRVHRFTENGRALKED